VKMFNADKTKMIGLPYCEKNCDNMLSRFRLIPERHGRTDRQTDRIATSISRVSMLTRYKNDSIINAKVSSVYSQFLLRSAVLQRDLQAACPYYVCLSVRPVHPSVTRWY